METLGTAETNKGLALEHRAVRKFAFAYRTVFLARYIRRNLEMLDLYQFVCLYYLV
jgi:hypothetical protein